MRPKPIISAKPVDADQRAATPRAERDALASDHVNLHCDEMNLHRLPKAAPNWIPKGMSKTPLSPRENAERHLAGTKRPKICEPIVVDAERLNRHLVILLVPTLVTVYVDAPCLHNVVEK